MINLTSFAPIERHPPCCLCGNSKLRREHAALFGKYVETHCPGYSVREAMRLVHEGEELVKMIASGEKLDGFKPEEKLSPFIWHLMYQAVISNQAFEQGTFVIKDPDHKIEQFFKQSKQAYHRWMSHFPGRTPKYTWWRANTNGIDISQNYKTGLPAHKRTVIWSRLETLDEDEYTFFKIEDWGFTGFQKILHTKDFISIIPSLIAPVWFGKHNKHYYREEYLPPAIYKRYHNIMKKKGLKHTGRDVTKFGLSAIAKTLEPYKKRSEEAKQLFKDLRKIYPDLKYAKVRTGHEVIFYNLFANFDKNSVE